MTAPSAVMSPTPTANEKRSDPPNSSLRRGSQALSSSAGASSQHSHVLPPLPPLVAFPSPAFGPQHGSSANLHSSGNNLHSTSRVASAANLATLPPPLLNQLAQPSPVHPQPASPHFQNLQLNSPGSSYLSQGVVCSCRNEPGSLPCMCNSNTPLLQPQRGLSQSVSMDTGFTGFHLSGASPVHRITPSSSPPARFRPSFTLPVNHINAAGTPFNAGQASPNYVCNSPNSATINLAAVNMVRPDLLPTYIAPGSSLEGVGGVSSGAPTPHSSPPPSNHPFLSHHHSPSLTMSAPAGPLPSPRMRPAPAAVLQQSMFSPTAPADLPAMIQRQPSVSPDYTDAHPPRSRSSTGHRRPSSVRPSVSPNSLVALNVHAKASGARERAHSSVVQNLSRDPSPVSPVSVTNEGEPGVPLTESTLRLLRKAAAILRNMFPSLEDVRRPEGQPAVEGASLDQIQSRSASPETSLLLTSSASVTSPPVVEKACCAPNPGECKSCGRAGLTSPAALSVCRCVTRPLVCYCGAGLHPICSAPAYTLSSDYCMHGHRGQMTARECLQSLTQLHSETANIWSHILGSAFMASHWWTSQGHWCLRVQAIASSALFAVSAIAHTFGPMSQQWTEALFRLDRCSISVTETAIAVSGAMVYYDRPSKRMKRDTLIAANIILEIIIQRVLLSPQSPTNRFLRTALLLSQGAFVFLPAWLELSNKHSSPEVRAHLKKHIVLVTLTAFVGAGLYSSFWPESWLRRDEAEYNRDRARQAAEAAKRAGTPFPESRLACSTPECCAVSAHLPSVHPRSMSPHSPSSPSPTALQATSTYVRFMRWLTDHFLHSHHLMHLSVIACTHFAFMWCARWLFLKQSLRLAAAARLARA